MLTSGSLPRYLQISEFLAREIAAGQLRDGERLPTEREMARSMGVAVGTLRKALADLAGKGLVERRQGSGNYVRASGGAGSIYAMFRLELADGGGGLPTAEVLSVDRAGKPQDLPSFGTGPDAHRIRRLRRLNGRVSAVEEIWLCASLAARIEARDLSDSLYLHYRRALGLTIVRAEDRVGQGAVPNWAPAAFPHASGAPVPEVLRIAQTEAGVRAEVSRTWIEHETACYVARIG